MKLIYIIFINLIFISAPVFSQDDSLRISEPTATTGANIFIGVPMELQNKTARFFSSLIETKIEKAFEDFLKNSPVSRKKEQIQTLINQTRRAYELYGQMKGCEPVNSEMVSESFIRLRYLGLHSKFPMRWIFTFYKSPDIGWIIVNIKFDDLTEFFFSDE